MTDNHTLIYKFWQIHLIICCFATFGLMSSCNSTYPIDIEEYYYPIDKLGEGVVYHYKSTTNELPAIDNYWALKSQKSNEKNLELTGEYFDQNGLLLQAFTQSIHPTGVLLKEYELYTEDTLHQLIPVEAIYNNVFPFAVKDSTSVYLYKLKFVNPTDNSSNTIVRNRRYGGKIEWVFEDKKYPAIRIKILEQIENDLDGVITIDLRGFEIYAKGIGLVYTERITHDASTRLIDRLVERIPLAAFEHNQN